MLLFQSGKYIKLALGIEYDGNAYHGWQKQKNLSSVQHHLEQALFTVAKERISVNCAGRTDAGVHATGQVIHFSTKVCRPDSAWTFGVNANLPKDISVNWVKRVSENFHARYSAISRRYFYIIYNYHTRPAIFYNYLSHCHNHLNISAMLKSSRCLIGEKDFTSFRSVTCKSSSSWRNVHHLYIIRKGNYVIFDIKANAFLHHMVRNIVGSLLQVGSGRKPEIWIHDLLSCRSKDKFSYPLAEAKGLYLVKVDYPSYFNIPKNLVKPFFLNE